jgi:nucleotide-binding universal stress UspA family protein
VTLTGKAGPALAQYVREMSIDLVVMSTHGRGGIRRAWLGSVADYLIRNLEVPVLLVRPREGEAGPALGWYCAYSILAAARPERVAAIVIATHGRGGLSRLALGSVADKVVRGADVPVLVYRPAGRGAAKKRSPRRASSRGRRAAQGGKR